MSIGIINTGSFDYLGEFADYTSLISEHPEAEGDDGMFAFLFNSEGVLGGASHRRGGWWYFNSSKWEAANDGLINEIGSLNQTDVVLNGGLSQTIVHGLNKYVTVKLYNEDDEVYEVMVRRLDNNAIKLSSNTPLLGVAIII